VTILSDINFQDVASSDINQYSIQKKLTTIGTAKRHAIKINDLTGQINTYVSTSTIKSRELISNKASSIAVFCNEYIPEYFPEGQYIKYILTINGKDVEIVPINSNKNGVKIVKTSSYDSSPAYIKYLNEDIKSATLSIIIKTPDAKQTPIISNLKILIGGSTNV
jgi:hypothetical protein